MESVQPLDCRRNHVQVRSGLDSFRRLKALLQAHFVMFADASLKTQTAKYRSLTAQAGPN